MSHQPPTQELVAKDLHGVEWRFRHIFRGNLSTSLLSDHIPRKCSALCSVAPERKSCKHILNQFCALMTPQFGLNLV